MKSSLRTSLFLVLLSTTTMHGICPYAVACAVGALASIKPRALAEKSYSMVFGKEEASDHYKEIVHAALEQAGIENAKEIPIKKMNGVSLYLAGDRLFSYSMFGIWLNEELLDQYDEVERVSVLHREAVQYAKKYRKIDSSARPLLDK